MLMSEGKSHRLDQQLSFSVYGAASRVARMHKPHLEPLGLTFPQYLVMLELYSGAPRTVGDLGAATGMDTGTITPLLKRMQVLGLLTRTRDATDERRVLVDLTPHGQSLRDDVWKVPSKIDSACQLTQSDISELQVKLQKLAQGR
jgi:DNA-binding MarR family transcriptional regulator